MLPGGQYRSRVRNGRLVSTSAPVTRTLPAFRGPDCVNAPKLDRNAMGRAVLRNLFTTRTPRSSRRRAMNRLQIASPGFLSNVVPPKNGYSCRFERPANVIIERRQDAGPAAGRRSPGASASVPTPGSTNNADRAQECRPRPAGDGRRSADRSAAPEGRRHQGIERQRRRRRANSE
jgi:hypothetical protein